MNNTPKCTKCGSEKWFYGHQSTTYYSVTSFRPSEDGDEDELIAVVDPTSEEETDCAWREVQCENGHDLDEWDRSIDLGEGV